MTARPNLLRRNLIGILVVLGVFSVLYLTEQAEPIAAYRARSVPEHRAAAGGSTVADGLTWQITSIQVLKSLPRPMYQPLPRGTVAHVVTISREGAETGGYCQGVITDGTSRWQSEGIGLRAPLPPDGTTTDCTAPGPVQFTFILPSTVVPTAVDVLRQRGQIMVRLAL